MITGMNHTGFVVRDLDRAVEFYRDVMGLTVTRTAERDGGPITQVVGYDDAHLRVALMQIGDSHTLELIQYISPLGSERPSDERNHLGAAHLAFTVDDIDQTHGQLVARGAQGLNPPAQVAPGRKACYLRDPEGNWIELLELAA